MTRFCCLGSMESCQNVILSHALQVGKGEEFLPFRPDDGGGCGDAQFETASLTLLQREIC